MMMVGAHNAVEEENFAPNYQEHMGSENGLRSISEDSEFGEKGAQKTSDSHKKYGLNYTGGKVTDSFIVDIERFASHLTTDKDISANSRIALQRSISRKGSQQLRRAEKKSNSIANTETDHVTLANSPKDSLLQYWSSTPEKPMVVVVGATEHSHNPQAHNPIMIRTGSIAGTAESKSGAVRRKFSFRRSSSSSWTIDPRRILFFFATLSSMGTILLIYFILSLNKFIPDDNGLNL